MVLRHMHAHLLAAITSVIKAHVDKIPKPRPAFPSPVEVSIFRDTR